MAAGRLFVPGMEYEGAVDGIFRAAVGYPMYPPGVVQSKTGRWVATIDCAGGQGVCPWVLQPEFTRQQQQQQQHLVTVCSSSSSVAASLAGAICSSVNSSACMHTMQL